MDTKKTAEKIVNVLLGPQPWFQSDMPEYKKPAKILGDAMFCGIVERVKTILDESQGEGE